MQFNNFDSTILGILNQGQGSNIAVEGTHRSMLRVLVAKFARRLRLRLEAWCALKHATAAWRMTPAMCPSYSGTRRQRDQRTTQGVVETRGPVGVSWEAQVR